MWRKLGGIMVFGIGMMTGSQVMADSLDLNLNNDSMRLTYEADMTRDKGLLLDAGYYYNDRRTGSSADLTHVGLYVAGDNWSQSGIFNIKVGGRLIYTDVKQSDLVFLFPGPVPYIYEQSFNVMALGLGGEVRFSPVHRLGIGASAYYAPRVASFLDGERYSEYGVKLDYQLLTQAYVYAGFRQINVEAQNSNHKFQLDDSAHVGLKILF